MQMWNSVSSEDILYQLSTLEQVHDEQYSDKVADIAEALYSYINANITSFGAPNIGIIDPTIRIHIL